MDESRLTYGLTVSGGDGVPDERTCLVVGQYVQSVDHNRLLRGG